MGRKEWRGRRWTAVMAVSIGALMARPSVGDDWPTYRKDVRRSGVATRSLHVEALQPKWAWRSSRAPRTAWAAPAKWDAYAGIRGLSAMRDYDAALHVIAVADRVYFGSSVDDSVRCLDASTGAERWTVRADAPIRIAPTWSADRVYFGSDDGRVYCVDAADGTVKWTFSVPENGPRILNNGRFISPWPCRSGVLVDGGTAYFTFSLLPWTPSHFCAVDALTGKATGPGRFVRKLEGVTLEGNLLATPTRIVAPQGRVAPLLLSRTDGKRVGGLEGGGGSFVTLIDDDTLLHGPGNKTGWITINDLGTRKAIAKHEGTIAMSVAGDIAYSLSKSRLTATDRATERRLWEAPIEAAREIVIAGDRLLVGGRDEIVAFDAAGGRRVWRAPVDGNARGIAVTGDALYVTTDEGAVHCFGVVPGVAAVALLGSRSAKPGRARAETDPVVNEKVGGAEPDLTGWWMFRSGMAARARRRGLTDAERRVDDLAGKSPATILGDVRLRRVGAVEALELDGATNSVRIADDYHTGDVPLEQLTVEAWVRVDQPDRWGGIVGAVQDDGDEEHGWVLGFDDTTFTFAVAGKDGPGRLTYLQANTPLKKGTWRHVVGVYDGAEQRIHVDGRLENVSAAQQGAIDYPSKAFFEMGAYHDKDEYYRMSGMLHEVRIYRRALTAAEIAERHAAKRTSFPTPIDLPVGPFVRFVGVDSAQVRWRTTKPSPTILKYGFGANSLRVADEEPKTDHRMTIEGLPRDQVGRYSIETVIDDVEGSTPTFELDTHFNYSIATVDSRLDPYTDGEAELAARAAARRILEKTGVREGICLMLGCGDGRLAYRIAQASRLRVIAVDTDARRVEAARDALNQAGVYGSRVTVHRVESFASLPFTDCFANLIVSERLLRDGELLGSAVETYRLLRPNGGVAHLDLTTSDSEGPSRQAIDAWLAKGPAKPSIESGPNGVRVTLTRGPLQGSGEWSHQYGLADNAAFGGEALAGAGAAKDLRVQWIGKPGPRAQPDRSGRKPAPLSVNGRLFIQGQHRLIGVDAYNGTILWGLEIPPLERFNIPRDCGNWCADDDHVFAAVGAHCWRIDAQSGAVLDFHDVLAPEQGRWQFDWGYVARHRDRLLGSAVKRGTAFTNFWGNADAGWYDARGGPATFKVCSDNLFALDAASARRVWTYANGVIIDSTITAADGKVFFVECRNRAVIDSPVRRMGMVELWRDQFLVALDVADGKKLWEQPLDTVDGTVVFHMAFGEGSLVIVSSRDGTNHAYAFDAANGVARWEQKIGWLDGKGDHGKAMSRPAIVRGKVYIRPRVLDLATGAPLEERMPGGGCGTYAATTDALIFRSGSITVWNRRAGTTTAWDRLRPGCWLSTIPAGGMLLSPEAGGGCSCGSWMETSIGFLPTATDSRPSAERR